MVGKKYIFHHIRFIPLYRCEEDGSGRCAAGPLFYISVRKTRLIRIYKQKPRTTEQKMITKILGRARIKLKGKLNKNPLDEEADFYLHSRGHAIYDGVVAIKKPSWEDPVLFELPTPVKVSARPEAVRIHDGNIVLKRGRSDVVFDGRHLKRINNATLDWDWNIFRAPNPSDRHVRRRSVLE